MFRCSSGTCSGPVNRLGVGYGAPGSVFCYHDSPNSVYKFVSLMKPKHGVICVFIAVLIDTIFQYLPEKSRSRSRSFSGPPNIEDAAKAWQLRRMNSLLRPPASTPSSPINLTLNLAWGSNRSLPKHLTAPSRTFDRQTLTTFALCAAWFIVELNIKSISCRLSLQA